MIFKKVILYKVSGKYCSNQPCKRASVGGGSGPPSLVPRDLTAEVVFDCPSLRSGFFYCNAPYGVFVSARSNLCYSLRSEFLLLVIRLTAFFISRYWATFCALSFTVMFSVIGSLCFFGIRGCLFLLGAFLYCSRGCIPFGDALGIL